MGSGSSVKKAPEKRPDEKGSTKSPAKSDKGKDASASSVTKKRSKKEERQAKKEKEKGKEKAEDKKKENQEGAGKEKDKGTDKAKGKDAKKKTGGNEETEGEGGKKKAKEKDEKQKKNVVRSTKKRLRKAEPAWNYNHELTTKRYADDVRIICLPSTHRPDLLQRLLRMQRLLLLYCCGFRIADCCCDFSASPYRLFRGSPSRHITRKFSHGYFILIRSFRCHM